MTHALGPILTFLLMLLAAAAPRAQAQTELENPDASVTIAPVVLDGVVLFRVRGASSLPAPVRATAIHERLVSVAEDASIAPDEIRVDDDGSTARILASTTPLMAVLDADAALEQLQRGELAEAHASRMRQAIEDYRAARSPAALRRGAINAVIATIALAVAVAAVWRLRRWLERLLDRRWQARIHAVGIQSFEVVRAERIWDALHGALRAVQTVASLAMLVVYLAFVLAQFPWTRTSARGVTSLALAPLQVIGAGLVANIPSLLFLAVLFLLLRLVLRLTRLFFDAVERGTVTLRGFDTDWAQPTYKIVRLAILGFGVIVAYPYIPGSQSAAFKGLSLFLGVVFSLGSSAAMSNMVAGYMMTYRRAFKVGDRIRIGTIVGDVVEMRLQVTHLRSPKNEEIIVPNSQILAGEVLNYSSAARNHGLILHTDVGIGYDTPWRQVEAMLLLAAERTEGAAREPAPFVLEKALGDFAVVYELNVYCDQPATMFQLYAELRRQILDVFNEYDVQIMTPAYEGDPSQPKVVPPTNWYAAPARRPAGRAGREAS